MKKYFAIILLAASLVACTGIEPQEPIEEPDAPKSYTMTIMASKAIDTKALSLNGSTLNATWNEGEKVLVYQSNAKIGELTAAASSSASTTLTGTFDNAPSTNADLTFYFHTNADPSYSGQNGTLEKIATTYDFCAPATVTTGNFTVNETTKKITVPAGISFGANQQAIIKFSLKNATGGALPCNPQALRVSDGTNTIVMTGIPGSTYSNEKNGEGVLYVAMPGFSGKTVIIDAYCNEKLYTYSKADVSFANSSYYDITVKMSPANNVDLSRVITNLELQDGNTVTETLGSNVKVSIANGATVTLSGATINGVHNNSYKWAGLNCLGNATIILADGTTNTVKGFYQNYPGIHVPSGYTLTINGETAGTGSLTASSNGNGAGIGAGWYVNCGNIIIKNGTINASGGSYAAGIGGGFQGSCGTIEIQGGYITATSSNYSAGIGGGGGASWGDISISGGTVIATGSTCAAGIGAGGVMSDSNNSYGNISISGGTVTAQGGNSAAGIGTGCGQDAMGGDPKKPSYCGTITISGGTVEATGGNGGAGIGTGVTGDCGIITITSGIVTATGAHSGAGIGAGRKSTCGNISVQGGQITAYGGTFAAGIGTGYGEESGENTTPSSCGTIHISGGTIDATGGDFSAGIGTGYIGNCGNITITTGVTRVTAKKGDSLAQCSIGTGYNGSQFSQDQYTITIGGTEYPHGISTSPYTYTPAQQ